MLGKIVASSTTVALVALWVMLLKTTPATAGPVGILAVFVLMYMSALGLLTFLLYGISLIMNRLNMAISGNSQSEAFTLRKAYYHASVVALAPVMLIGMQSVNEVGVYQLLLVVFFVFIAWLYISKRTS